MKAQVIKSLRQLAPLALRAESRVLHRAGSFEQMGWNERGRRKRTSMRGEREASGCPGEGRLLNGRFLRRRLLGCPPPHSCTTCGCYSQRWVKTWPAGLLAADAASTHRCTPHSSTTGGCSSQGWVNAVPGPRAAGSRMAARMASYSADTWVGGGKEGAAIVNQKQCMAPYSADTWVAVGGKREGRYSSA